MVLAELTTYLAAAGLGLVGGTNLFYGPMKASYPDAVTLVQLYGGIAPEPNLGDDTPTLTPFGKAVRLEFPRVQVLCRGVRDDTDTPLALATSCEVALLKIINTTLSGIYYLEVAPIQHPFRLRTDENFREEYAINFQVTKEHS